MKGSKDLRLAVSRIGTNFFRGEVCIFQVLCPSTVCRNRQKARYNLNLFQTACGSVCVRAGSRCCRFITQSLGRGNQRPFYLCSTFPFAARAEDHFFLPAAFVFGPHFAPKKPAPSFFRGGSWPALRTNERKQYSIRMAIAVRPEVACERGMPDARRVGGCCADCGSNRVLTEHQLARLEHTGGVAGDARIRFASFKTFYSR